MSDIDSWKIIESYYMKNELIDIQLNSYNFFITNSIPEIISNSFFEINLNKSQSLFVYFKNIHTSSPHIYDNNRRKKKLYPKEALNRDLTYETEVKSDIINIVVDITTNTIITSEIVPQVELFKIPVMIHSCICNLTKEFPKNKGNYKDGGYFIIKGKERVLVAQENINYNQIYIYKQKLKCKYIAEIRSIKVSADYSVLLQAKITNTNKLVFNLPYILQDIPIFIVFKAIGFDILDKLELYVGDETIRTRLQQEGQLYKHYSKNKCIEYISKFTFNKVENNRKINYTKHILQNEIAPHIGTLLSPEIKGTFLLQMVLKLLNTEKGLRTEDDKDHICNKRIEMVGDLMGNLIRSLFKNSMKSIKQFIEKKQDCKMVDINIINKFNITSKIFSCFTTGNWGIPQSNYIRQGVSQILNRLSYIGTMNHLRKVIIPIGKESRNTEVRQIHCSNYGFICPVASPEGQSCGTIKNFSLLTKISTNISSVYVIDILQKLFTLSPQYNLKHVNLYVNGIWLGSIEHENVSFFITQFKYYRNQTKIIPSEVSISFDDIDKEINILSGSGRILRPVIDIAKIEELKQAIKKHPINYLWNVLIEQSIILYIDGSEAETSLIAMYLTDIVNNPNLSYDYGEIKPCLMLGLCANVTPFPNHSQAPRNVYTAAMMKQAVGLYHYDFLNRFDTVAHVLYYPQKKLVSTKIATYCHAEEMPAGINCVVAVMCYTGYNQEDSILINKSAVDRGLFCSITYKSVSTSESKKGTHDAELIQIPEQKLRNNDYNYSKLDENGIVKLGENVVMGDVLVGKVYYNQNKPISDCSMSCKSSDEGIIDKILHTTNASGYRFIKIRVKKIRIPEIGDKFCEISAQKGVCGHLYNQEDMPFTAEGICPDIIINPHALPSRMTINMLMEMLSGKLSCMTGELQDCSAFEWDGEQLIQDVGKKLVENGYQSQGYETLYNGFTGKPFKAKIFMGTAYYQRLKHMVSSKLHSRSSGNVQLLTRQPCAGRSRDGGLRFGEMEKDCMVAHGVSTFLKERLFNLSDEYQISVCDSCGTMVNNDKMCYNCENDISQRVNIPYACKLFFQQLQALGIKININPKE